MLISGRYTKVSTNDPALRNFAVFQKTSSLIPTLGTAYAGAIGKSIGSTAASAKAVHKKKSKKMVFKHLLFLAYTIFICANSNPSQGRILNMMVPENRYT